MRRVPCLVLLLCALLLGAGCGEKTVQVGGVPRQKVYRSVVSLSPSTTEIMLQYCNGNYYLKGRTAADDYPPGSVARIPVVASLKPDLEKIKAIHTDLVVYDSLVLNDQDVAKIKALGVDTFAISAPDVKGFIDQLYRLANLVGGETNMSDYVDRISNAVAAAQGDPITPKPKLAIIMPGAGGANYVNGTESFLANAATIAGAEPIGPKADRFVPLDAEALVSQNPDAIVVPVNVKDKAKAAQQVLSILNDSRFKNVKAIQTKKIAAMDEDVLLRRGSRVDQLIDKLHKFLSEKS